MSNPPGCARIPRGESWAHTGQSCHWDLHQPRAGCPSQAGLQLLDCTWDWGWAGVLPHG